MELTLRARRGIRTRAAEVLAVTVGVLLVATTVACSSDTTGGAAPPSGGDDTSPPATSAPPTTASRPSGPAATIVGPMTGGKGVFLGAATPVAPALEAADFVETEYTASGSAVSYTSVGDLPVDGTFSLEPGPTADYVTRIVVRRPADPADFNGTVAVEWLNVSGGVDAGPDFTYLAAELLRGGYVWVGVSAQRIGVEGGPVAVKAPGAEEAGAGTGLRTIDPERYDALRHPGDAFAYDMYTQVARWLRAPGDTDPLDGFEIDQVLAVGESQSAFALTTYYDGVQPLTEAFDGFLIHSRGGAAAPLETPSGYIDIASSLTGKPTTLRTDQDTPVIVVQTESDVLGIIGYYPARQPDAEHVRIWEIAGTAHADAFQIGGSEAALGCATPINRGQQVFVLRAALRSLRDWVADGTAPPSAELLETDGAEPKPAFVLDDVGNVRGGIRTPSVDAPVDVLSGLAPEGSSVLCLLLGSTTPIPADQLTARYPTGDAYLEQYEAATDDAIEAGFVLAEDRDEILADADPSRFGG